MNQSAPAGSPVPRSPAARSRGAGARHPHSFQLTRSQSEDLKPKVPKHKILPRHPKLNIILSGMPRRDLANIPKPEIPDTRSLRRVPKQRSQTKDPNHKIPPKDPQLKITNSSSPTQDPSEGSQTKYPKPKIPPKDPKPNIPKHIGTEFPD